MTVFVRCTSEQKCLSRACYEQKMPVHLVRSLDLNCDNFCAKP
jgi:hypothetical protein